MPCYDQPPAWEGAAKESAEQAVTILCELISARVGRGDPLSVRFLTWYLEHRLIDHQIAAERKELTTLHAIQSEIEIVRRRLALALS